MSRMRRRAEAELVLACAPIEDGLTEAKTAHADEGSVESRAAKRDAMAALYETRAWLRAADELRVLPGKVAGLEAQLKQARKARDDKAAERVQKLEGQLAHAKARHERIERDFGPLVQAMQELAAGGER